MRSRATDASALTLRDFARSLRARNRSRKTIESYLDSARQLAAFRPGSDVATLSRRDIEDHLADVLSRLTASTAATRYRALQQLFTWCVEEELIASSPMAGMRPPAIPERPLPALSDARRRCSRPGEGKDMPACRDTAIIRLFLEPGGLTAFRGHRADPGRPRPGQRRRAGAGKVRRPRAVLFGAKTGSALTRLLRLRPTATSLEVHGREIGEGLARDVDGKR